MFGHIRGRVLALLIPFFGLVLHGTAHAEYASSPDSFDATDVRFGQELSCLALNIYHEGRGEPARGQAAIAAVTMNRVRNENYPDTICDVVWQYKQFSWTLAPASYHGVDDAKAWKRALILAKLFIDGARSAEVGDATHYHTSDISPYWIADNKPMARVGNHVFYIL